MSKAQGIAQSANQGQFKNRIINGAMQISQRGTTINSISSDNTYTADRFYITRGGTINYTQGTSSPPIGFQYYASYINQTASNPFLAVLQAVETLNCFDLAGQVVTISAWLKAAANTTGSKSINMDLLSSTSANTKPSTVTGTQSFTLSSSEWTKCTITVTVPSDALTIGVRISTGTLAVSDGIFITGVQLEKGSTATIFDYRPYGTELALCQRYFVSYGGNSIYEQFGTGFAISTGTVQVVIALPVFMRTNPSFSVSGSAQLSDGISGYTIFVLSLAPSQVSQQQSVLNATSSGLTQFRPFRVEANNNTTVRLGFSAEL